MLYLEEKGIIIGEHEEEGVYFKPVIRFIHFTILFDRHILKGVQTKQHNGNV